MDPKKALLVVDIQNDFCPGGALPIPEGDRIIPAVNEYIRIFAKAGFPVLAAGFNREMLRDGQLFPDSVIEVQPTYPQGGKIVWQWRVWDHLVQDRDRSKGNYGDVGAPPELVDTAVNGRATQGSPPAS